jgi:hypothetical protein
MKLVVSELTSNLGNALFQPVRVTETLNLVAVRPKLYLHNHPTGSVKVSVCDTSGEVLHASEIIDVSAITDASYFHGHVRFYIEGSLLKDQQYWIKIEATGYTFSEDSYIGVCHDFDFNTYPLNYDPSSDQNKPLDIQFWQRTNK